MSKYIVEIKPEYEDSFKGLMILGAKDSNLFVDVLAVEDIEELNSDYINEHFSELQDKAYQRGFEDGKASIERGCGGCRYESKKSHEEPCFSCARNYMDQYELMPKQDDTIRVGDEVNWFDEDTIVVTMVYADGGFNWCDGVSKDGRAYHMLQENVRKTGKHYDIASILEAMHNDLE